MIYGSLILCHICSGSSVSNVIYDAVLFDYKEVVLCLSCHCREPGLVDSVLTWHAGSQEFDSYWGHMSERFFHPIDQDIRTQ